MIHCKNYKNPCKDCKFWERIQKSKVGECHKKSPIIHPDYARESAWPITHEDQWCGEAEAKEK